MEKKYKGFTYVVANKCSNGYYMKYVTIMDFKNYEALMNFIENEDLVVIPKYCQGKESIYAEEKKKKS